MAHNDNIQIINHFFDISNISEMYQEHSKTIKNNGHTSALPMSLTIQHLPWTAVAASGHSPCADPVAFEWFDSVFVEWFPKSCRLRDKH